MMSSIESPARSQEAAAEAICGFLNEREAEITTPIIDVPAKNIAGNYATAALMPSLIDGLRERISAEDLGRRWKQPGMAIPLSLPAIIWAYELGRAQLYLDKGWPGKEVDLSDKVEAASVMTFWAEMMRAYRNDGCLLPGVGGATRNLRILADGDVAGLADQALAAGPPSDSAVVRKAFAQLGLYSFVLHAEDRVGMFNHGPYDLADGRLMVVKEFSDLQNRILPWVTRNEHLDCSRLVVPLVLEDVECDFDLFGTLTTAPDDYLAHAKGMALLAGDDLAPIDEAALRDIGRQAQKVQGTLFRTFVKWDDRYMAAHGGVHFANVFAPIFVSAGYSDDEIAELLIEPFDRSADNWADSVVAGAGADVWVHVAAGEAPVLPALDETQER